MAKKSKSRNKRKSRRSAAENNPETQAAFQLGFNEGATRNDEYNSLRQRKTSALALRSREHSHAEMQSGVASLGRAPLTDRNLQTFLEQHNTTGLGKKSPIVLNMDGYAREPPQFRNAFAGDYLEETQSVRSNDLNGLLLQFGQLNPSLDHLSDSTSLDDVCFPDYYDGLRDHNVEVAHAWPDLSVLKDFILEEIEDMKEESEEHGSGVNFHFPIARKVSSSKASYSNALPSTVPASSQRYNADILPTTEESPLLNLIHVNEATLLRLAGLSMKLRIKPAQPWEKLPDPTIPATTPRLNSARKPDEDFRFTYFRENIDGTIHSPTLSGLVSDSQTLIVNEDQVMSKLQALFTVPPQSLPVSGGHLADTQASAVLSVAGGTHTRNGSSAAVHSRTMSLKADSPHPLTSSEHQLPTRVNSAQGDRSKTPFWLDVVDPSEEEMKVISKTFGLHPLTTEDIFLGETREKVELFRQYYFICFTSFDIVYERMKQRAMEFEKKNSKMLEYNSDEYAGSQKRTGIWRQIKRLFNEKSHNSRLTQLSHDSTSMSRNKKVRTGELSPLNMYMIVFEQGILTFHFKPTPHPVNVRRRARLLKDHLTVSTDWICYALIDDITDAFAPMIDSIEQEVYHIEDEIMKMHSGNLSDSDDDDDLESEMDQFEHKKSRQNTDVFYRRQRSKSVVEALPNTQFLRSRAKRGSGAEFVSLGSARNTRSRSSISTRSRSTQSKIVTWKRKGDMLRRIGECRKRVMSVVRLLGSKADVVRGFSKRFGESDALQVPVLMQRQENNRSALRQEIQMYLSDIQDHIVTMVQSLNHYEKLLARSHSNYLAQINIDMTKVNNDTNDILGKVTILGTIVLPINVVTGLWGMNCIVPGQDHEGLVWFYGILVGITMFSVISYIYARKVTGL